MCVWRDTVHSMLIRLSCLLTGANFHRDISKRDVDLDCRLPWDIPWRFKKLGRLRKCAFCLRVCVDAERRFPGLLIRCNGLLGKVRVLVMSGDLSTDSLLIGYIQGFECLRDITVEQATGCRT